MESFWNRVTSLLNTSTVVELARLLDVKRSTLSSWIHSDRRPPMEVLLKITRLTGVDIHQLERGFSYALEEEDDEVAEHHVSSKRFELIEFINSLDDEELEVVWAFLRLCKRRGVRTRDSQTARRPEG
ncbi:MAG: helix-turn-helix transcriptional regulator [Spirochaetales bacterium]|nr:helix-turn-helix transcriptional regulator [Spirochaetales bacterium]